MGGAEVALARENKGYRHPGSIQGREPRARDPSRMTRRGRPIQDASGRLKRTIGMMWAGSPKLDSREVLRLGV